MGYLRDTDDSNPTITGEYCGKHADMIFETSLSRYAGIEYNAGRLELPALFFVVKRYIDATNFTASDFFQVKASFVEGFCGYWKNDKLTDKKTTEKTAQEIRELKTGVISSVETKTEVIDPPQLYDTAELQRDGNEICGYTAFEVLEAAQRLYETHKILTYPRTESRYVTTDMRACIAERIIQISSIEHYKDILKKVLHEGLNMDGRIINDNKAADCHAILVTEMIQDFDMEKLSEREYNILHLVITRILTAVCSKYTYEETTAEISFANGITFYATCDKPVSMGWKAIKDILMGNITDEKDENNGNTPILRGIKKGQTVNISSVDVITHTNAPPKLHTEGSLLTAMRNAGNVVEKGVIIKGGGIGTQTTGTEIIKSLFDNKYIANKRIEKVNYLIPTKQGISLLKAVPCELYNPKIAADWEKKITEVIKGKLTENDFLNEYRVFIEANIGKMKTGEAKDVELSGEYLSDEKEEFAKCFFCGAAIYENQAESKSSDEKGDSGEVVQYYCSAKCGFSLRTDNGNYVARTKKNLTESQMRELFTKGSITATCVNRNGVIYTGQFTMSKNAKGYTYLNFSLPEKKDGRK